jgi:mercuric ion binding protein
MSAALWAGAAVAQAAPPRIATLDVTNMDCAACPITVRLALQKVPGVHSARVDFETRLAVVAFDAERTSPAALARASAAAGYPAIVKDVK